MIMLGNNWLKRSLYMMAAALLISTSSTNAQVPLAPQNPAAVRSTTAHGQESGAAATALQTACNQSALQELAKPLGITVTEIPDAAKIPGGAKYVPATAKLPAYCEVIGSFVTDQKAGKTANFLAVFPEAWNTKFLQIGCSGTCGNFFVSDPTSSTIVISNQGTPGESIAKGYASFSTDEGHATMLPGAWAIKGPGQVDQGAIDDLFYRADQTLANVGKIFTALLYSRVKGTPQKISRSYFIGCSEGGRDALVAASLFPDEFDGIISGSPYAEMVGAAFQFVGGTLAELRSPSADVPPEVLAKVDPFVKAKCDELDGVKDGLIQNPAACNFIPSRDLPICEEGKPANACFTKAQIESISVLVSAVTDEQGKVVQPGYTVSELLATPRFPVPPKDPLADEFPSNSQQMVGSPWSLGDSVLKIYVHHNDPDFHTRRIVSFTSGGSGAITNFHIVVPRAEVDKAESIAAMGVAAHPDKLRRLIDHKRKLLIWANLSDQTLTPYMSVNYYKQLAMQYGGYSKLQQNVRLFLVPGTGHCSMFGCGPQNFDPLSAMEQWVEHRNAPDTLIATQYPVKTGPSSSFLDFTGTPVRTMPLCKFPEMAHYAGSGDVNVASNWSCPSSDTSMLTVGESGKQAGVLQ